MNTEKLFQELSTIHPVSEEFKIAVEKELTLLSLPKYYLLLEAPNISGHAYFLNNGSAITYTFVKGKKQTEAFWSTGKIIVSAKSFFEQVPSREFIQLMEQADVLHIRYNSVLKLLDTFPEANHIYRITMNQYYEQSKERTRDMQHLTAKERYQKLLKNFPHIEQISAQEHIASYLGITPQSLSRLKRQNGSI